MKKIAVVGAAGNTGSAAVQELLAFGENPLCVVRNAEKARQVLGHDVDTAVADADDREALKRALPGIGRLLIVTGHNPRVDSQQINIIEAAKAAGVKFILKVSGGRSVVGPDVDSIVGRGHHAVEQALQKSGIAWTILRPGLFMQNTFAQAAAIKSDGKIVLPFAKDLKISFIDVRDTGAVAARILRGPDKHHGRTYELSGTQSSYEEFAKVFSEVLGKPVTYVGASLEAAEAAMKRRNMPEWLIGHMLAIARGGAEGAFTAEHTTPIRDIVGRAPITMRQFVQDHKGIFN
jgi:NAD(P)H dehydrogenase (quinone)